MSGTEAALDPKFDIKPFERPAGHSCSVSTGIHECLTFGTGPLDDSGFWAVPCFACAREHAT